jgi:hypothetical protein
VRELRNVLERAAILCDGDPPTVDHTQAGTCAGSVTIAFASTFWRAPGPASKASDNLPSAAERFDQIQAGVSPSIDRLGPRIRAKRWLVAPRRLLPQSETFFCERARAVESAYALMLACAHSMYCARLHRSFFPIRIASRLAPILDCAVHVV